MCIYSGTAGRRGARGATALSAKREAPRAERLKYNTSSVQALYNVKVQIAVGGVRLGAAGRPSRRPRRGGCARTIL